MTGWIAEAGALTGAVTARAHGRGPRQECLQRVRSDARDAQFDQIHHETQRIARGISPVRPSTGHTGTLAETDEEHCYEQGGDRQGCTESGDEQEM